MIDAPNAYQVALDQLRAERDAAQARADAAEKNYNGLRLALDLAKQRAVEAVARADAAEKERDDLAAKLGSGWIEREVDVRVLKDAQVSSLRDQLNAMTDARDGAIARADQCEQDAHVSRQNLNTLSAMFRAAISAVVRA